LQVKEKLKNSKGPAAETKSVVEMVKPLLDFLESKAKKR